ncbi:hypothetical protein Tco_0759029 [Tanacetum coccineum]
MLAASPSALKDRPVKNVGNWFAGRAAQTHVADYQYDGEASGMGQLVVPVYHPDGELNIHIFGEDDKSPTQ